MAARKEMHERPKGAKPVQITETDVALGVATAEPDHAVGQVAGIATGAKSAKNLSVPPGAKLSIHSPG